MNPRKEMQAVILAGGLGTRLRPITEKIPKPMVSINGKPFLEYKLDQLRDQNIKNVILCVSYLGEQIENYFRDGKNFGVNLRYSYEKEPLGTAGAIKNAESLIEDSFILMNGDTYSDINFLDLFLSHNPCPVTMVVTSATNPLEQELVKIEKGIISQFYPRGTFEHRDHLKKNSNPSINAGVYVIDREILNLIPSGKVSLEQEIFPALTGRIKGFEYKGYIIDISNIRYCKEFEEYLRRKNDN